MPHPSARLARQESLSDEIEVISNDRGPSYFNGASHGSTGLAPPQWKFEFERPAGDDYWHKESQPSPHLFNSNKHQYVWGSDRAIFGSELGNRNVTASTMPLDVLERRKSFTKRPIAIVSGTHGAWHGNDWDSAGGRDSHLHEQAFLSEDVVARLNGKFVPNASGPFMGYAPNSGKAVKGDLSGFVVKRDPKSGLEYYVSDSAKKGSFDSRIRIYDGAKLTEADVRGLIANLGNHVILGYCFGRNDEALRYKGAEAPLAPVTSYLNELTLPIGGAPGQGYYTTPGSVLRSQRGRTRTLPAGSFIEDAPGKGKQLIITEPHRAPYTTQTGDTLWMAPDFSPKDSQAPTAAAYQAHYP
ncbi:hypothetical protein KBJ94_29235 [Pseudomonas sp. ITA]|uniref:hypothetical protein n=1 Tax=Pseudomonas sp. ITA TaxID=2825841 RepID=UPI002496C434|nr:hypothetical protein [Pseudomonas sp. ITA]MDI2146134.1 hypothetical protein [Pseudomonas sp. ITA]